MAVAYTLAPHAHSCWLNFNFNSGCRPITPPGIPPPDLGGTAWVARILGYIPNMYMRGVACQANGFRGPTAQYEACCSCSRPFPECQSSIHGQSRGRTRDLLVPASKGGQTSSSGPSRSATVHKPIGYDCSVVGHNYVRAQVGAVVVGRLLTADRVMRPRNPRPTY